MTTSLLAFSMVRPNYYNNNVNVNPVKSPSNKPLITPVIHGEKDDDNHNPQINSYGQPDLRLKLEDVDFANTFNGHFDHKKKEKKGLSKYLLLNKPDA